jgi:hypothetical protein
MKKLLVMLGSMAAIFGAAYADRYTGEHPHGAEWGLVDALHPLNDYGIFRKMPDGMRSGGSSSGVRTGVPIVYPDEPIVVDNTATGQNRGDEIDKVFYYSSPAWAQAEIYQTEIYGASTVTVGGLVPNASYIAEIHFAETYSATQNRVFRSRANGTTLVCGVKPPAAGMGVAHAFATNVTADASGQIVFQITNYADNGIFGGYAIWGAAAPSWTNPAIVADGSDVKMTWSDPHDVLRYYVYSADSAEGPWTELDVFKPGVSSYTIPGA